MQKLTHIGLLVDASRAYGRGICRGVADFAESRNDWVVLSHERPELNEFPLWLRKSRVDGIIAYIPNQKLFRRIITLGIPAVDVHGRCGRSHLPVIETEAVSIARLAIEFFLKSGFEHLAYCGYPSVFFSDQREEAFLQQSADATKSVHVFNPPAQHQVGADLYQFEKGGTQDEKQLADWLGALPKPVGVMACNDIRGQQVINACRELGIRVPEEVAVMGIDNDEIICRLCRPTLTSIEPDMEQIGRLAAQLIATRLSGRKVDLNHQIPPRRIVERQSTDTLVAGQPAVEEAARLIRTRISTGISVEQICEALGTSRSTLDNLFLEFLGRTLAMEIKLVRLQYSQNFLLNSNLTLSQIARRCGFSSATYFCRFFKRETNRTPLSFRLSRPQATPKISARAKNAGSMS